MIKTGKLFEKISHKKNLHSDPELVGSVGILLALLDPDPDPNIVKVLDPDPYLEYTYPQHG